MKKLLIGLVIAIVVIGSAGLIKNAIECRNIRIAEDGTPYERDIETERFYKMARRAVEKGKVKDDAYVETFAECDNMIYYVDMTTDRAVLFEKVGNEYHIIGGVNTFKDVMEWSSAYIYGVE